MGITSFTDMEAQLDARDDSDETTREKFRVGPGLFLGVIPGVPPLKDAVREMMERYRLVRQNQDNKRD